jgi:lysophospholipase L1-like esterase
LREDLDPKIEAVRRIAKDYNVTLIPLDGIFQFAANQRNAAFWAADGVHPTQPGHALLAQEWMKAIGE